MPGIGDILFNAMGPDPNEALKKWSATQTAQNAAAINPNAPPGGIIPGAMSPQDAAALGPQAPPQEPQAYKTPQDLGSLLMDLQQRESADQGLNSALGLGFAAFAQPRDRQMVSQVFNRTPEDPQKIGDMLLNAQSATQGQARNNQLLQMANTPDGRATLAKQLNTTPEAIQALAMSGKLADAISTQVTPTPGMAGLAQIERYMGQVAQRDPSKSPEVLAMIKNAMISGMGGPEAEAAIGDAVSYKARTGQDAPWVVNGAINQQTYKQYVANETAKETDRGDAAKALPKAEDVAGTLYQKISNLKDNPAFQNLINNGTQQQKALAKQMLTEPDGSLSNLSKIAGVGFGADTGKVVAAISELREITGKQYQEALHSIGVSRFSTQEVESVNKGMGQLTDLGMPGDAYNDQAIGSILTSLKKVRANNFGATGNMNTMPTFLRPYVNKTFLPKGELYKEGSGAEGWAEEAHKPLPPETLQWAKDQVKADPRKRASITDHLQSQGYDVEEGAF